jgi:hypothetical protein
MLMTLRHHGTRTTKTTLAALALTLAIAPSVRAGNQNDQGNDNGNDDGSRIQRGFAIAPVPLKLAGKNRALVGLGSYFVNGTGDCGGCHAGPAGEYAEGGDPFQGQPKVINKDAYLAGGAQLFGPLFIPRNLTPDKTGRPARGASFEEFRDILRTGIDPDHAHPHFGPFLQVMPWPSFQNMTDRDIRAIYEYLGAIPCIEGDPGLPDPRPIGTRCK